MQRLGHILSIVLVTAGLVVIADVGVTLAYQEPISSIYGSIKQSEKVSQLHRLESSFLTQSDIRTLRRAKTAADSSSPHRLMHAHDELRLHRRLSSLAQRLVDQAANGDAIGRIEAADMDGLNMVFVQGTDESSLQLGPGHYPETAMPGQGRTIGIAGHRTTYLAPFRHIDSMKQGDPITLKMPYGTFVYRVQKTAIVDPSDVGVVRNVGYERLVLSACNPLYSAAQRFIVFARLAREEPRTSR